MIEGDLSNLLFCKELAWLARFQKSKQAPSDYSLSILTNLLPQYFQE